MRLVCVFSGCEVTTSDLLACVVPGSTLIALPGVRTNSLDAEERDLSASTGRPCAKHGGQGGVQARQYAETSMGFWLKVPLPLPTSEPAIKTG